MYKLTKENNSVIRKTDGACIPLALGNRDYQEFLEWIAEGNIPEPAQNLEEIKAEKEQEMQEEKRKAKVRGVIVDGVLFDTDDAARLSYIEFMLKQMINPSYSVAEWKASEGVWVTMDSALFGKLIAAWEIHLTTVFSFVKAKENELKDKTTVESIQAVDVKYKGV